MKRKQSRSMLTILEAMKELINMTKKAMNKKTSTNKETNK